MRASLFRPQLKLKLSYQRCRPAVSQKNRYVSTKRWPLRAQLSGVSGKDKLDAVVILGGGLDASQADSLPSWVKARLNTGARIFSEQGVQTDDAPVRGLVEAVSQQEETYVHLCAGNSSTMVLCLGGGTPHKPAVVENNGQVLHEATACARFLTKAKVRMNLLQQTSSPSISVFCISVIIKNELHSSLQCRISLPMPSSRRSHPMTRWGMAILPRRYMLYRQIGCEVRCRQFAIMRTRSLAHRCKIAKHVVQDREITAQK